MNMLIVYHFAITQKGIKYGYVFPSELEGITNEDVIFAIKLPVLKAKGGLRATLGEYLSSTSIVFLCELNGEYVELNGIIN